MQTTSSSQDDTATDTQPSRLLQLPKELQLTIWEFALTEQNPIPFFRTENPSRTASNQAENAPPPKRLKWSIPPLLQTCHSIRLEGTPVFYTSNMFILQHKRIFSFYQESYRKFDQKRHYLSLITDFGIEYTLPSSNAFLLHSQRKLVDNAYTFFFTTDAAPSHQRPLTALEASETDSCLCMIKSMIKKRRYATVAEYTEAMIAFLASFAEKISRNELRVLRFCQECGKKMVEQKPRRFQRGDLLDGFVPVENGVL